MFKSVFAREEELGTLEGIGPLGEPGLTESEAVERFGNIISGVIGFLTVVAGIWFIFQFIIGAIGWLSAGGDKVKVELAQKKITQGIIGLAVVVSAVFLIELIGNLLGLKVLSPGQFILGFWK
jgi:hypothetical protein